MRIQHRFPVVVAFAATAVLVAFRLFAGAGWGAPQATPGQDLVPSGFLYGLMDNMSYVAWAQQGAHGSFLLTDLYATEEHPRCYFNPLFFLIGQLARLFGTTPATMMIALGILSYPVVILCVYFICLQGGMPERAARWSTVLAAFGAGLSAPARMIAMTLGRRPPLGADLYHHDAFLFQTFYAYPYQAITCAVLALVVLGIVRMEKQLGDGKAAPSAWLLLALGAAFLASARPYEPFMLLCSYAAFAVVRGVGGRRFMPIAPVLVVLVAAIAPFLAYYAWISTQPVWGSFAQTSLDLQRSRAYWLLGYGLLMPAALVGAYRALRAPELERVRWLAVWVLMVATLLLVLNVRQVKVSAGAALAVCLLAGLGCDTILREAMDRSPKAAHQRVRLLLAGLALFFFMTAPWALASRFTRRPFSADLLDAASRISELAPAKTVTVLCGPDDGNILPALHPIRVYAGHFSLTPDLKSKQQRLQVAGFTGGGRLPAGVVPRAEDFVSLLEDVAPDFVLVRTNDPAIAFAEASARLETVATLRDRRLYSCGAVR